VLLGSSASLPFKVAATIIGLEKRADAAIRIEGNKGAIVGMKPGDHSIATYRLENGRLRLGITQRLGGQQVVRLIESWEIATVLGKVLAQTFLTGKSNLGSYPQGFGRDLRRQGRRGLNHRGRGNGRTAK
jgi:hypothetical protein